MKKRILKRLPLDALMDLKIDYAFKQLFGIEKNKHITIIFLNALLQRNEENRITDLTFENTEFAGDSSNDKKSRLDILARINNQDYVNIEIQFTDQYDMVKRSLYYWSNLYRKQMKVGDPYCELKPVITVNILNFNLFGKTTKFHTSFHLFEDNEAFQLTDVLEMHFIEIPKLINSWKQGKLNPQNDILARWLLLLGIVDRKNKRVYQDLFQELEEIAMKDPVLQEAFSNWEQLSADEEKQLEYEGRLKEVMDKYAAQREAELRLQKAIKEATIKALEEGKQTGIQQGIKEGKQQGIQQGIEQGIQQGKQEERKALVKRLLLAGVEIETIATVSEMTIEQIKEIQLGLK